MNQRELEMQIQDLLEGQLEEEALDHLQQVLRRDPAAQATYREYALLQHCLKFRSKGVDLLRVVPMEKIMHRRRLRAMKQALMATAAALMIGTLIMALVMSHSQNAPLTFKASPGSDLVMSHQITDGKTHKGQVMEEGSQLWLKSGSVELEFRSGVRSVVKAPAKITLVNEALLDLHGGTAWFTVPAQAHGFQVRAPNLVLTDLGTEFGIISHKEAPDEAHVFRGKVKVLSRRGIKSEETLTAGQARKNLPDGGWEQIELNRSRFLSELPDSSGSRVRVDARSTFTNSPNNEMVRIQKITFGSGDALSGFNPGKSDKLVVTLSHENGSISEVTYGGVRMSLAAHASANGSQQCAIYYLDAPGPAADLMITGQGKINGVGGSILALSNTAPGPPTATQSTESSSLTMTTPRGLLIATHAFNTHDSINGSTARAPMIPLFSGPTGSSAGGSGFQWVNSDSKVTVKFDGGNQRSVTAAATFAPIQ